MTHHISVDHIISRFIDAATHKQNDPIQIRHLAFSFLLLLRNWIKSRLISKDNMLQVKQKIYKKFRGEIDLELLAPDLLGYRHRTLLHDATEVSGKHSKTLVRYSDL
jgi:hypothetical protein